MEWREHVRFRVWLPVRLDSDQLTEVVAVSHDASAGGLLLSTAQPLDVGMTVAVTFRVPPDAPTERTVAGTVVRVEANKDDPDGLWPYRVGISFSDPIPDFEHLLKETLKERESIP